MILCSRLGPADPHIPETIARLGCTLTGYAAVLNYHRVQANTRSVNTFMDDPNHFFFDRQNGEALSKGVNAFSNKQVIALPLRRRGRNDPLPTQALLDDICRYGPQVARVSGLPQHWVVVYGRDTVNQDWLIMNTANAAVTTMTAANYGHFFEELPFRRVQPAQRVRRGTIRIGFRSPVQAFITDPSGKQLGFDPRHGYGFQ